MPTPRIGDRSVGGRDLEDSLVVVAHRLAVFRPQRTVDYQPHLLSGSQDRAETLVRSDPALDPAGMHDERETRGSRVPQSVRNVHEGLLDRFAALIEKEHARRDVSDRHGLREVHVEP